MITVFGNLFCKGLSLVRQKANGMMQGTEGTDPAAKKPSQNNSQDDRGKGPKQPGIQCARGYDGAQGHQGIQLQKQIYGPAPKLPPSFTQRGNQAEPQKQEKEKKLADLSGSNNIQKVPLPKPCSASWFFARYFTYWAGLNGRPTTLQFGFSGGETPRPYSGPVLPQKSRLKSKDQQNPCALCASMEGTGENSNTGIHGAVLFMMANQHGHVWG
jgi:hypothetical protein